MNNTLGIRIVTILINDNNDCQDSFSHKNSKIGTC